MIKKPTIGFGFMPEEAQQHFLVVSSPVTQKKAVAVYERFKWDTNAANQVSELPNSPNDDKFRLKVTLHNDKWNLVKPAIEAEFNRILKSENKKVSRFKVGQVPVERLLGKEMMVLLWAIEDCEAAVIPNAVKNWLGLTREERWWLFTMTNAATGDADNKRGWRIALRYAITDNPVSDDKNKERNLFASLTQRI